MSIPRRTPPLLPLLAAACGLALVAPYAGAQGTASVTPADAPTAPAPLEQANALYAAGDLDGATAAATMDAADPAAADAAHLLLARIDLRRGLWDDARRLLAAVGPAQAKYVPAYATLLELLAADRNGALAAAPETERRIAQQRLDAMVLLPEDDALDAQRLELVLRLDDALALRAALVRHAAAYVVAAGPAAARRWTARAEDVLADASALTGEEVGALYSGTPRDSPLWPSIARRRAETALAAGDLTMAGAVLDQAAAARPGERWIAELRARARAIGTVDAARIGALVPTTGPAAEIGARALAAMGLALTSFGDRFTIEARDTGGDEATTREAVRSLVQDSHAIAIVGPLEARVAQAAAAEASAQGVPLIALNVQRDVADAGACRFRDFPTFAAEVEALVAYAWDHARGHRFVVLRAAGRYGELLAGYAADAVERRGGEVVDVAPYAADQTEFGALATAVRRARPDAILFADAAAHVALVAPALAYEDLWPQPAPHDPASPAPRGTRREALYLLPSAAADPAKLGEAQRYVEGAVAAVGFVGAARPEDRTPFEAAFDAQYSGGPSQLDAFAHDAAQIVATLVAGGATNRPALCRALDSVESLDTAAPFSGFDASGEAHRPVRIAVIRDGRPTLPSEPRASARGTAPGNPAP